MLDRVLPLADPAIDFSRYTDVMLVAPYGREGEGCMWVGTATLGKIRRAIQQQSYEQFLQKEIAPERRDENGLQAVFKSVF